jgi:hypothetical protein
VALPTHIRKFVASLSVALPLTNMTNAQTLPDSLFGSGSVPGFTLAIPDTVADSLQLLLLDHAIALAEIEERRTSFWYRLIPDVRVSANLGVQQLVFIDPSTYTPYVLPKDAYRLTLSLSLSEVFNFDKHTTARIQHDRVQVQRQLAHHQFMRNNERRHFERIQRQLDLETLKERETLINDLVRYTEILFNQGESTFDDLVRVRLQQLHIKHLLNRVSHIVPATTRPDPK